MAENSRFFGGPAGSEPQYTQVQFAEVFKRFFTNGYFPGVDGELAVTESDPAAMSVAVAGGQSWIEGYWHYNDTVKTVAIPTANATNPRIDRVILRLDTLTNFKVSIEILQGTAGATPVARTLTQNSQVWELSLARVYVSAGATSILNADITDGRLTALPHNMDIASQFVNVSSSKSASASSDKYNKGITCFRLSGATDSLELTTWFNSLGFNPLSLGRQISDIRAHIITELTSSNLGIQTITLYDWSASRNYRIYGIFRRAANSTSGAWGEWATIVTVYESGSNSDGYYIKYSDGTQDCWARLTNNTINITTSVSGIYRSEMQEPPFPSTFVGSTDKPVFVGIGQSTPGNFGAIVQAGWTVGQNTWRWNAIRTISGTDVNLSTILLSAKGRWR